MSDESRQDRVARWQRRVEEAPDSAAAHFNLGLAHTERGRMLDAEKAYRRAVELDPELVQAWVNLGGALLMKWDFQGCLEANQEAVRRKGDLVEAHYNMGQAYLYLKNAPQLVRCNRRVLELQRNHPAAHYFLAVGLLATDQVAEARAECARAASLGYQPRPEFLKSLDRAEEALVRKVNMNAPPEAPAEGGAKEE